MGRVSPINQRETLNTNGAKIMKKRIEVVAAIIRKENKILATQRGSGEFKGKWEFPGGKIEVNETKEEALLREIKEELNADINIISFIKTVEYEYDTFYLSMHCYWCKLLSAKFQLLEHEEARWLGGEELLQVEWLPADIALLSDIRISLLNSTTL